jgi:hypothetical protein
MEILVAILVFVAVLIVAGLIFGGWVIVSVLRLLGRLVGGGRSAGPPARLPPPLRRVQCPHTNCRAANAPSARFCRRCGRAVDEYAARPGPVVVRRVAMW